MSEKRRDSKGRILRTGESQRKDGRYAYKYTDACGKTQFVYAWKLVPTDKTPTGKRDDVSLREKVKEILRRGDSVAFQNLFTMQLSISGTFEEGGRPDPAKGNVLKPRVRIAPAFIKELNKGIAFVPKEGTP